RDRSGDPDLHADEGNGDLATDSHDRAIPQMSNHSGPSRAARAGGRSSVCGGRRSVQPRQIPEPLFEADSPDIRRSPSGEGYAREFLSAPGLEIWSVALGVGVELPGIGRNALWDPSTLTREPFRASCRRL